MPEFGKFGAAVIEGWHIHRPEHPIWHVCGAWNLEKMPSSVQRHGRPSRGILLLARISLFGRLVPCPTTLVNPRKRDPAPCKAKPGMQNIRHKTSQKTSGTTLPEHNSRLERWRRGVGEIRGERLKTARLPRA